VIRKSPDLNNQVRAVAPVVGFLLVVAIIFLAAAQYQTNVVPEQERQQEADHFTEVTNDMSNLRSQMISASSNGQRQTQELSTGMDYGVLGLNQPPVPGVFLHLDSPQPIEIHNATNNQAAEAFWDGDRVRSYETGFVGYRVDYNRFSGAGELYIEHGFMYQDTVPGITPREYKFDVSASNDVPPLRIVEESDQPIIDGRTITLYTVQDGLQDSDLTSSGISDTTVELNPTSPRAGGTMNAITVTDKDSDSPIRIVLPTRLPASEWRDILRDEMYDPSNDSSGYIKHINESDNAQYITAQDNAIEIVMKEGETYNLRLSLINIQTINQRTPTVGTEAEYVAIENPVANVREESTILLSAEARDKYNNGVIGQEVQVEARRDDTGECIGGFEISGDSPECSGGSTDNQPGIDITNEQGTVNYRYEAPEVPEDTSISFVYRLSDND
jgi:hypothetical protein